MDYIWIIYGLYMGYIWIISEYATNKGGIRVEKKHPATQQFRLALLWGEFQLLNYNVKLNLFPF
jgi:hypothetical protein